MITMIAVVQLRYKVPFFTKQVHTVLKERFYKGYYILSVHAFAFSHFKIQFKHLEKSASNLLFNHVRLIYFNFYG